MDSYTASEGRAPNALTGENVLIPCKEFRQEGSLRYAGVVGKVCEAPHGDYNMVSFPTALCLPHRSTFAFPTAKLLEWQIKSADSEVAHKSHLDWTASEESSGFYSELTTDTDSVLESGAELSDGETSDEVT